tara:strand:- start:601 stop:1620 length:1020 start_codon:yes stop_codon:yes gene_type:complete
LSDIQHTIIDGYLPQAFFKKYSKEYPIEWIKEYCSNPEVSEHESSLYGNYSAGLEHYDLEFLEWVENQLPAIKLDAVGRDVKHDHFYTNFHYDERGSWLEPHNDLKDMRWLVTSQIYMNNNQGARLLDRQLEVTKQIPCHPNLFYSIVADPWSWHDVPEVSKHKQSILFRVGKRRSNSIAHPDSDNDTAYVIYNNFHKDKHYAKLGPRLGNITEAWLHNLGAKNIMHSFWRSEDSLKKVVKKGLERHTSVVIVLSGYLPSSLKITANTALQTVTNKDFELNLNPDVEVEEYFRLTDENMNDYADCVFSNLSGDHPLVEAEQVMYSYYANKLHLNYIDLF